MSRRALLENLSIILDFWDRSDIYNFAIEREPKYHLYRCHVRLTHRQMGMSFLAAREPLSRRLDEN